MVLTEITIFYEQGAPISVDLAIPKGQYHEQIQKVIEEIKVEDVEETKMKEEEVKEEDIKEEDEKTDVSILDTSLKNASVDSDDGVLFVI